MHLNEKIVHKVVGVLLLTSALTGIVFNAKEGYTSFGVYLIPMIFVVVSSLLIFGFSISDKRKIQIADGLESLSANDAGISVVNIGKIYVYAANVGLHQML